MLKLKTPPLYTWISGPSVHRQTTVTEQTRGGADSHLSFVFIDQFLATHLCIRRDRERIYRLGGSRASAEPDSSCETWSFVTECSDQRKGDTRRGGRVIVD